MKFGKAVVILSYETIADILFFILAIISFSMIITTYVNVENQISASEIAKEIGYSMKQAIAAGESTKIYYYLPSRFCKIKITKDKIYVRTEESDITYTLGMLWNNVVALPASWFGIELRYGDYEIINPVGKYIDKDYEIECLKIFRKLLVFLYENGKLQIIEHGMRDGK